jgi:prevent-host-death family protein
MLEVSAYEAKAHLEDLLRKVKSGKKIIITKHHVPIAMMMPVPSQKSMLVKDAVEAIKSFRKGKTLNLKIKETIAEGRR